MLPRIVTAALATLSIAGLAACGGEEGPRPQLSDLPGSKTGSLDYCTEFASYDYLVLSDFSGTSKTRCPAGIACSSYWASYELASPLSKELEPIPAKDGQPPVSEIPEGLCGQPEGAARLQVKLKALKAPADSPPDAAPFASSAGGWGGVLGATFNLDASAYDGLSLFLKRGPNGTGHALAVSLPDLNTVANTTRTNCGESSPTNTRSMCDSYGLGVGFDDEWRFFTLPFLEMRQRGFGMAYSRDLFLSEGLKSIQNLKMELAPSEDWDFSVARIALYRKKAP